MDSKRRQLMLALAGMFAAAPTVAATSLLTTPRQSAGPFYPLTLPLDDDNDLTRVSGRDGQAAGQISDLNGRIVDINGRPLKNLRIEIWQCDANGRYRHPRENGRAAIDENFQGHGHNYTDEQGRYRFRTIRPVPYPGRTPHIHVAVFPESESPFVTQLYVKGEAQNASDFLFKRVPAERRHLVVADFQALDDSSGLLRADFDIILNRRDGTPLSS